MTESLQKIIDFAIKLTEKQNLITLAAGLLGAVECYFLKASIRHQALGVKCE